MLLKHLNSYGGSTPIPKDWKPDTHFLDYKYDQTINKSSTNEQQNVQDSGCNDKKPLAGIVKSSS